MTSTNGSLRLAASVVETAAGTVDTVIGAATGNAIRAINEQTDIGAAIRTGDLVTVRDLSAGATVHRSATMDRVSRYVDQPQSEVQGVGILPQTVLVDGIAVPLDIYSDFDGGYFSPVTLPVPVHEGQRLILRHGATLNTTFNVLNTSLTAPLILTSTRHSAEFVSVNGLWHLTTALEAPTTGGNVIAMTPIRSPVETVVTFDGIELKWHNGAAAGYDGLAIRVPAGPRLFTYSSAETYLAQSIHDAGNSTWGSANRWYAIPTLGTTATLGTAAWPHHFSVNATFVGMGNPALPQTDYRLYMLYDHTNNQTYKITFHKNGSTGEVLGATQNGYGMIIVERVGLTSLNVVPVMGGATSVAAGTAGIIPAPPAGGTRAILLGNGTWAQRRLGTVAIGDVGSGTGALIVAGDIASAIKSSGTGPVQSTVVVTFTAPMPSAVYVAHITPLSIGTVGFDNDVQYPLIFNRIAAGFSFYVEETVGVAQNLSYMITVEQL